jgi:HNH endonuclease
MNFEDEDFVRVYTRETPTWLALGFEGQTALMHLLRKCNSSGKIEINNHSAGEAAMRLTRMPLDFANEGVRRLLEHGVLEQHPGYLLFPRFIAAQSAGTDRKPISETVRLRVLELHGMVCWLCTRPIGSRKDLHLDHVRPRSRGGENIVENLRPAHAICNMRRGARSVERFRQLHVLSQEVAS